MPVARATGWRLRAGTHTAAALTSTYNVVDLAIQADQNHACPWTIDSAGTTPPKPARIVTNADLSRSGDGFTSWKWRMSYMTNLMVSYWLTTFLPGGVESAEITALTYNAVDTAEYYQALIWRPEFPSSNAQHAVGGWGNVIWEFTRGVQVFP
jgi:hypothetical protein